MQRIANSLSLILVVGVLTAMVFPLDEATKIIEASPIKNWTSNEQISYSDLNNNFNHLHANLGHGHGPIITANDIASNAAIRPEQTTFGLSTNRALVNVSTWKINPDAGTAYVQVNNTGSLVLTVTRIADSGVNIDGAAATGVLPDAGTNVYTVFYKAVAYDINDLSIICVDQASTPSLHSPLHIAVDCVYLLDLPSSLNYRAPSGISIQVYSNKVQ